MQGAATVRTAFRFRPRGEVAVDACQKRLESAVANDFADHLEPMGMRCSKNRTQTSLLSTNKFEHVNEVRRYEYITLDDQNG